MPDLIKPAIGNAALRRARVSLDGHVYHVTTTTHARAPLFGEFTVARAAVRSINHPGHRRRCSLVAWVLMPDHLHVLLRLASDASLGGAVDQLKSGAGRAVNRQLRRRGPVWQRAFHDHLVRDDEDLRAVARYIILNPLRAGLVTRISQYPHWDAIWLP